MCAKTDLCVLKSMCRCTWLDYLRKVLLSAEAVLVEPVVREERGCKKLANACNLGRRMVYVRESGCDIIMALTPR